MRVIIATGVFPPEIGGPAYYSKNLAEALQVQGHTVRVVLYGVLKKCPSGIRHALYAFKLAWASLRGDVIIAFDTYSVGLPAAIVGRVLRIPVIIRIGGDFIWEMYTQRTGHLVPLPYIYDIRGEWSKKERSIFSIQSWVIRQVHLAFTCEWIRDIWIPVYGIPESHAHVIQNAIPARLPSSEPERKNFIFYTRQISLKNASAFKKAFIRAKNMHPEIELEEGVLPKEELDKKMASCYAVVLPSISDVTPNYIIDAIRYGKPFLLTKHSGYADQFKGMGAVVDPLSEDDMTRGVLELAEDSTYLGFRERITAYTDVRTYDGIAHDFVSLAAKIKTLQP